MIVDYIHILDIVHSDLKLSNFGINLTAENFKIKLIDLDFLMKSNQHPEAKIFGTPDHIAPEILKNRKVTIQSDNYSFGVMLGNCLEYYERQSIDLGDKTKFYLRKLSHLKESLMQEDPTLRPRMLIPSLKEYDLIDSVTFEYSLKTILALQLISGYWKKKLNICNNDEGIKDFFIEKNRILGFGEELLKDMGRLACKDRTASLEILKDIIGQSRITNYDNNWQIEIPDQALIKAYETMGKYIALPPFHSDTTDTTNKSSELIKRAGTILSSRGKGNSQKTYLYLRKLMEKIDPHSVSGKRDLFLEMGNLATSLNRPEEAYSYLTKALEIQAEQSSQDREIIYKLAYRAISIRLYEEAIRWIELGIKKSKSPKSIDRRLHFFRLKAWICSEQGDHKEAIKILKDVKKQALKQKGTSVLSNILHDWGLIEWRVGNFKKAENYLTKCINSAKKEGRIGILVSAIGNLSMLNYEQSRYKKAIHYGKQGLKHITKPSDYLNINSIYPIIALSYSRLNENQKSLFWLQKIFDSKAYRHDRYIIQKYYACRGTILNNHGNYEEAKDNLHKAVGLSSSDDTSRDLGKMYFNLAEIAFNEGDYNSCVTFIDKSNRNILMIKDESSMAEISLISVLNDIYNGDLNRKKDLVKLFIKLIEYQCKYYASLCLFHIIIHGDKKSISTALKNAAPLLPLYKTPETPIFKALSRLLSLKEKTITKKEISITDLKSAYRVLGDSGCRLQSIFICIKIAKHYLGEKKGKLASRFYEEARNAADSIGNKRLFNMISKKTESAIKDDYNQTKVVDTIFKISEILKNIGNYENALEKVVEFIVGETGAERGALLIRSSEKPNLIHVRAFVNCDEDSFNDIKKISQSIPEFALTNLEPLVIDDALKDKRTKNLKSILAHNIRSVICIPIAIKSNLSGVLYLDHHTIPALFEQQDILFVKSIANFLSVILSTIQEFKNAGVVHRQLVDDMQRMGIGKNLITKSSGMLKMISKLPEIAKTNVSMMLKGESGTGKEILCEMIHRLSLRSEQPLIKLNCAAVPDTLIESELFGVAKNTATGVGERSGKFSAADGGSLFLDEIGDMPLEVQAKVLRVLEYQEFEKVGSNRLISTDCRFIYATNKDLNKLMAEGKFREDLYHRINTVTIEIPPLRERIDDIPILIEYFINTFCLEEGRRPSFSEEALKLMLSYEWPGNVRELKNLIERYCILLPGGIVKSGELPKAMRVHSVGNSDNALHVTAVQKARIQEMLEANNWNQSRVARILNIPLSTFRRKIKKYNISRNI
jgi:Nif-specific regulatory protein